jgi:hypothetical protein
LESTIIFSNAITSFDENEENENNYSQAIDLEIVFKLFIVLVSTIIFLQLNEYARSEIKR